MKKLMILTLATLSFMACQESLEKRAEREATEYTEKNCPLLMNSFQVLDSFTFDKATHTFGYYYSLKGMMDTVAAIQPDQQHKILLDAVKNTTNLKAYKDENYSFKYIYRSHKDPQLLIYETTILPEEYK